MNYQSMESIQPIVNIVNEASAALNDKNQEFLKENYMGVIGYITIRLNLVNFK